MSGRRVGLVIKSSGAWFSDPVPEGWLYRGRNAELLYWMGHTLPIVLLFYNPDTAVMYWVHVAQDNAQIAGTGWKILIPSSQILDPQAVGAEYLVTPRDLGIFVDQAAKPVPTQDPGIEAHNGRTLTPSGRSLAQCPVRAVNVIMLDVLTQDQPQMGCDRTIATYRPAATARITTLSWP